MADREVEVIVRVAGADADVLAGGYGATVAARRSPRRSHMPGEYLGLAGAGLTSFSPRGPPSRALDALQATYAA
jgi:hypothetical protein